jgi:hypothetical protein
LKICDNIIIQNLYLPYIILIMKFNLTKLFIYASISYTVISQGLDSGYKCDGGTEIAKDPNGISADDCCTFCETNRVNG